MITRFGATLPDCRRYMEASIDGAFVDESVKRNWRTNWLPAFDTGLAELNETAAREGLSRRAAQDRTARSRGRHDRPRHKDPSGAANDVALKFPTMESIAAAHAASGTDPAGALRVFLDIYYDGLSVWFAEDDFHAVTLEFLTTSAARNVRHVDLSFDPQAHTTRGVPIEAVMNGLIEGAQQAERETGITTALIMCINRDKSLDSAFAALDQAMPWREHIAGFGLDSNEAGNPPEKFVELYARARSEGYRLTAHCDVDQTNAVEHIRRCVDLLHVERIDHGMNVIEDDRRSWPVAWTKTSLSPHARPGGRTMQNRDGWDGCGKCWTPDCGSASIPTTPPCWPVARWRVC